MHHIIKRKFPRDKSFHQEDEIVAGTKPQNRCVSFPRPRGRLFSVRKSPCQPKLGSRRKFKTPCCWLSVSTRGQDEELVITKFHSPHTNELSCFFEARRLGLGSRVEGSLLGLIDILENMQCFSSQDKTSHAFIKLQFFVTKLTHRYSHPETLPHVPSVKWYVRLDTVLHTTYLRPTRTCTILLNQGKTFNFVLPLTPAGQKRLEKGHRQYEGQDFSI